MFGEKDLTKTQIGMAKPIYYSRDGKGRDSYISTNNGGLNKAGHLVKDMPSPIKLRQSNLNKLHYTSNGSGRDSYIVYGSGGLVNSGHLRDIYTNGFLDTLRTPKKPMTAMERCRSVCKSKRDKNDFYIKTQAFSTIKQQQASSTFRKYQMKKDIILSKPKRLTKKYVISSTFKFKWQPL